MRFVVLQHDGVPDPHFDLMYETSYESALSTWQCPVWPMIAPTAVARLADHRRHYLDYEGKVSGGRGVVTRVAMGTCEAISTPAGDIELLLHNRDSSIRLLLRQIRANVWEAKPR